MRRFERSIDSSWCTSVVRCPNYVGKCRKWPLEKISNAEGEGDETSINVTIVNHESAVRVFQSGVGRQDGVVRFDDSRGDLRGWVNREFQFGFFPVINAETFHQQ